MKKAFRVYFDHRISISHVSHNGRFMVDRKFVHIKVPRLSPRGHKALGITRSFPRDHKVYLPPTHKLHRSAAERLNFRSNVRISGRTFEILAERLGKWRWKTWVWSPKTGFQNFSLDATWIFLNTNFNMQRSKISDIIEKRPKMNKQDFAFFSGFFWKII